MREVYFPHFSSEPGKRYVGDSRGMEHLIGAYWVYDDLRARPEVSFKGKQEPMRFHYSTNMFVSLQEIGLKNIPM